MDTQQATEPVFPLSPIEENTDTPQNVLYQKFTVTVCIIIVLLVVSGIFLLASKSNQPDTTASSGNQLTQFDTKSDSKSVAGASTDNGTYGPPEPSGGAKAVPTKKPQPEADRPLAETATTAPAPTAAPTATPTPQPTSAPDPTATPTPTPTATPTAIPPTPTVSSPPETPTPTT